MAVFDYVRCLHALPDGFADTELEYQTKDMPDPWLEHYTITVDGRLIHHFVEYEWVPDPDTPFGGHLQRVAGSEEDRVVDFDGELRFYTSNVCIFGPDGIATEDDAPPFWREYVARFHAGRLERIEGGLDPGIYAGRPHRPRAELNRRRDARER
jgi:hypothetical protein